MPAQPKSSTPATDKPKAERGPNAAHLLLASIKSALAAGVDGTKLVPILDMALSATGAQQAPAWKMCAGAIDSYTKAVTPAAEPTPTSA